MANPDKRHITGSPGSNQICTMSAAFGIVATVGRIPSRTDTIAVNHAGRLDGPIDHRQEFGIMDARTKALLMTIRKVLREILGALEDYLEMERSIERRIR